MLCHLSDSCQMVMGERAAASRDNFLSRTVLKWIALQTPLPWPKGVKTRPEADQAIGGTRPVEFEQDRQRLIELIRRFVIKPYAFQFRPHPMFGAMTEGEWMRSQLAAL
jgi:hypothetical protein